MLYFDFGYARPGRTQIGLWQPVTNCFLLCLDDIEIAREIKFICNSRYVLQPVFLETAHNWRPNLIDNHCCENWTIDHKILNVGRIFSSGDASIIQQLVPNKNIDSDCTKEKQWLQTVLHWTRFLQFMRITFTSYPMQFELIKTYLPELDLSNRHDHTINDFGKQMYQCLVFETEQDIADKKIRNLMEHVPEIERYYELWTNPSHL